MRQTGKTKKSSLRGPAPFRIGASEFSPDGKSVIFAAGQSANRANEFALMEIELESGNEREFTTEKFFNIKSLEWLPGGKNLFFTASRNPDKNFRIWQISATAKQNR